MLKAIINRRFELAKEKLDKRRIEKELEILENNGYTRSEIILQEEMMWAMHGPNVGA